MNNKCQSQPARCLSTTFRMVLLLSMLQFSPTSVGAGNGGLQEFPVQGFAVRVPENWSAKVGNSFGPFLPPDTVTLGDAQEPFSVNIVAVALEDDLSQDVTNFAYTMLRKYRGLFSEIELTVLPSRIGTLPSIRIIHEYPGLYLSELVVGISEFVVSANRGYWLSTEFYAYDATHAPATLQDAARLDKFEQIVDSFALLDTGKPSATLSWLDKEKFETLVDQRNEIKAINSFFTWPTSGYIGFVYKSSGHNGIDIWTTKQCNSSSTERGNSVYSVGTGVLDHIYKIPGGANDGVRIRHGTVNGVETWTHYWHLGSLNTQTGQQASFVATGTGNVDSQSHIGYQGNLQRNGDGGSVRTTCIHLHLTVANGNANLNSIDPSPYFNERLNREDPLYVRYHTKYVEHSQSSPPPPPACPTSDGVILYKDWQYQCGGEGEGYGWVRRSSIGFQNVPSGFNDKASSVRVPTGWSVKLYEHSDRGGGHACRSNNDDNFAGGRYNSGASLNDSVSSFEVFDVPNCGVPNSAPNTLSPQSPPNGHTVTNGSAPTLCWSTAHDPDGDPVQYYAEVYGSAINANSGWINDTCWRPSSLDNQFHQYQWYVKARDSQGAESGWSSTWHFTIQRPNQPPNISFDTANGNSASLIDSREQTWAFAGTASDPDGSISRVEFRCNGCDNAGSGPGQTGGGNWSLIRSGMAGQNDVYFVAVDNQGASTASRHLDLRVDLAPPVTTLSLNGQAGGWPTWFTNNVQVRLQANDQATGRARSGVNQIRYRVNGGSWQSGGSDVTFIISNEGQHSIEYYAVDNVGNQEGSRTATFRLDRTPPTQISGVTEINGAPNDQWQRTRSVPTFTWAASSDAYSGVSQYQLYFGTDPNGQLSQIVPAGAPRQWTPQPGGVRTGTYYLRGRVSDVAGNYTNWQTLFIFRYDGTPPQNPGIVSHAQAGVANDTWQRLTSTANFTWPPAYDEGSGIAGYGIYWGPDPNGTSASFIATDPYQSPGPLCGPNEACTGYLRLRSRDNVGHDAENWSTNYVLRFDNQPPVADFSFNNGITQTTQTLVTLNINATDGEGSGLHAMRLSGDGQNWTDWEAYAEQRLWTIPGISRRWWPVYLQVRDAVGLESTVISRTIYLDVNVAQPRSENFRLFDHAMSAGAGEHGSTGYQGRSTVGQVLDSAQAASVSYRLVGGYQAGSQAIPLVVPGHDEYRLINGIFASGTGGRTLTSPSYSLIGTLGEPGLPNNQTTISSQNHRLQPGFLAASLPVSTPTPTPTPGPTPPPPPVPACDFPRISINEAALFTNSPDVTLSLCAPYAVEMMVSNDGGFAGAQWEPYAESKAWTITTYGQHVLPRFVYAAFKNADGSIQATYFDDIIYDPTPPEGQLVVGENGLLAVAERYDRSGSTTGPAGYAQRNSDGNIDLYIIAIDDNSGLAEMQINSSPAFTDTEWQPYSAFVPWSPEGGDGEKTVYARFRDTAGNISQTADAVFLLDTMPPIGGMALVPHIVGPDIVTTTVYLGSEDNLSGVNEMRISEYPGFADAPWLPYSYSISWPIELTGQTEGVLYVQYRDLVGNLSEVFTDTYLVDTAAPLVYVEVAPGDSITRTLTVLAYDGMQGLSAGPSAMRLTNDPFFIDSVLTQPYTSTVTWIFDDRQVVWVQVKDAVGNWGEPYPAFAGAAQTCDLAGDGMVVTVLDIQEIAQRWLQNHGYPFDVDGDGVVTIFDIMWYTSHWGNLCE